MTFIKFEGGFERIGEKWCALYEEWRIVIQPNGNGDYAVHIEKMRGKFIESQYSSHFKTVKRAMQWSKDIVGA